MRRTLTLILIVIVAIGSLYALVRYIKMDSLSFAWILNFLLMLYAFVFTDALKSGLTSSYYNAKGWERRGKIYEYLGINLFRKLLVWTGWEKVIRKSNPIERNARSLKNLHYETKKSELGHLIILIIVFGFNVFVAVEFGFQKSLWLLVLNVLLHLYPIFLQRYNRPRIERAMQVANRHQLSR